MNSESVLKQIVFSFLCNVLAFNSQMITSKSKSFLNYKKQYSMAKLKKKSFVFISLFD